MTSESRRGIAFGSIWGNPDGEHFARVDGLEIRDNKNYTLFSLWDVKHPGWQEGAALENEGFLATYSQGPFTEAHVRMVEPPANEKLIKIRITGVFEYWVDTESAKRSYKTTDPDQILEIDQDNMWEILSDELASGDGVVLSIERVEDNGE